MFILADEDSNLTAPEVRRKPVNRIVDSDDSDAENPAKEESSDSEKNSEIKDKEEKLKYLTNLFPQHKNTVC